MSCPVTFFSCSCFPFTSLTRVNRSSQLPNFTLCLRYTICTIQNTNVSLHITRTQETIEATKLRDVDTLHLITLFADFVMHLVIVFLKSTTAAILSSCLQQLNLCSSELYTVTCLSVMSNCDSAQQTVLNGACKDCERVNESRLGCSQPLQTHSDGTVGRIQMRGGGVEESEI